MQLLSLQFLAFALTVALLFHACSGAAYRRALLTVGNACFIASFAGRPTALIPMATFLMLGYLALLCVGRWRKRSVLAACLLVIVGSFVFLKQYAFVSFLGALDQPYIVVGLSYLLFRIMHLVIDRYGNSLTALDPLAYFRYTCFFGSFLSGPIQRYEDYADQEAGLGNFQLNGEVALAACSRIATGLVKLALIAAAIQFAYDEFVERLWQGPFRGAPAATGAVLTFTLYLYFNFAGYMDVVVGLGWLIGFKLPENFNRPFAATSFIEFWTRWHMTLSDWFKTYVFGPIQKALVSRWPNTKTATYLGVVSFFISFTLMGIWHGSTVEFVVLGLAFGCGVSINKLYQVLMRRWCGKKRAEWLRQLAIYRFACSGLTLSYFATTLWVWWMDLGQLHNFCETFGYISIPIVYLTGAALCGAAAAVVCISRHAAKALPLAIIHIREHLIVQQLWLSIRITVVALSFVLSMTKAPTFVYQEF